MRLGVFDSGVGGLSVLKSLLDARLFEEIVYYGDTARVPYGTKDKDTIIKFSLEALEFFKKQKIDILIIACNTVSAYAIDTLKNNTNIKIYGVIDAGVKATIDLLKDKNDKILIIATKATINSKQYQNRLIKEGFTNIHALATPLFVPMVEEGIIKGELVKHVFDYYFSKLVYKPNALIMGCTHFPFLKDALQEYFGKATQLIHSGNAIVNHLKSIIKLKEIKEETKLKFYASSDIKSLENTAKILLK